jgi:hypothetical protein
MRDNATLPPEVDLDSLFHKKSLFDSIETLEEAGFQIVRGSTKGRVAVFGHPSLPGYLFKKFLRDANRPYKKQSASYERRVEGARALRAHLDALSITSIVVPRKWLCELPRRFHDGRRPQYVIVVEKYDLLERDVTKKCYGALSKDTVRDLCTIFFAFERVDFAVRNMPFTTDGKIGFIDTGYLRRITKGMSFRRKSYKKNVEKLPDESQRYAESLWDEFKNRRDLLRGPR